MTRPEGFRFRSGEFAMIGLMVEGKPIFRAYSIASPAWAEELEFFSIKVPDGPLTSHLQAIKPGDQVLMRKKPTGTLVLDALTPGRRLYMFSTGTGIAPFASLIRDPETYEKFEQVILTHTTRDVAELKYGFDLLTKSGTTSCCRKWSATSCCTMQPSRAKIRISRPHHRPDLVGQAVHRSRRSTARPGNRPRHDLRLLGDAEGHQGAAGKRRPRRRRQQQAGTVRHRARVRRLIERQKDLRDGSGNGAVFICG
jgi:hypothetical protein